MNSARVARFRSALEASVERHKSLLALLLLAAVASAVLAFEDWDRLFDPGRDASIQRRALDPWISRARGLDVTWDDAMLHPRAAAGKPVRWALAHLEDDRYYFGGDFNKKIEWIGGPPSRVPKTGMSGRPPYVVVVGVLRWVEPPDRVGLKFLGLD